VPKGRNKSEQVRTWLFVGKSEPSIFLHLSGEQAWSHRPGATGWSGGERVGIHLQRITWQLWALNMIWTASEEREVIGENLRRL